MLIYLAISALLAFACSLVWLLCGEPTILAVTHLVFAVGVLPLIVAAITHFVPVLTRSGGAGRLLTWLPVGLQLAGMLILLHFVGVVGATALSMAALFVVVLVLSFVAWLLVRAGKTLGRPHPGWRWYLAAMGCLALGVALVPVMYWLPAWRAPLRLLHLHLNTLGCIGLTAIGTLQVLLPTVLSGPDEAATRRLRSDLPTALGGCVAVACGAAWWRPLALLGGALLLFVALRLAVSWLRVYGMRGLLGEGAALALSGSLAGFVLVLTLGAAHGWGWLSGHDAVLAFVIAFLLPLVSGALSHLLPLWLLPGRRSERRDGLQKRLKSGSAWRTALFLCGGVLTAFGYTSGVYLAATGLLLTGYAAARLLLELKRYKS